MNRWTVVLASMLLSVFVVMGCSGGGDNPMAPNSGSDMLTSNNHRAQNNTQTQLWGYYSIYIDVENQVVESVVDRTAMFNANVVAFLNSNPAALGFNILETPMGPDYIDVDIEVTLTHPLPGLPQYDGYDVRGIFIGDGSLSLSNGVTYSDNVTDQGMFGDPDDGRGAPDGYTRWYNAVEFNGGLDVLAYTEGIFAAKSYTSNATLNPYKYFADGLGANDDVWAFLNGTLDNGVFSSGSSNTRTYYLRFPNFPGPVNYDYSVVASWKGEAPEDHPANTVETVGISTSQADSSVYYDPSTGTGGGDLVLDLDVFGWEYQPSTLCIEGNIFSGVSEFNALSVVTGGTDAYSSYHVEVPADSVLSLTGNEFWVIAKYGGFNYGNEFGIPNDAEADVLAAYFRVAADTGDELPCTDPAVISITPDTGGSGQFINDAVIVCDAIEDGPSLDAYLTNGTDLIQGTDVSYIDGTSLSADFLILPSYATGAYDVVVTNGCGGEGTGVGLFTVGAATSGWVITGTNDLPSPDPTPDPVYLDFCAMGDPAQEGVYYHWTNDNPQDYKINHYTLDYDQGTGGTTDYTIFMPYIQPGNQDGFFGGNQYCAALEVTSDSSCVFTTKFSGPMVWGGYNGNGPVWWFSAPANGTIDNGYIFFSMRFVDLEASNPYNGEVFGAWCAYPAGVQGATFRLNPPWGIFSYFGLYYYYGGGGSTLPVDTTGGTDGLVYNGNSSKYLGSTDNVYNGPNYFGIDTDPQEPLAAGHDVIWYYLEEGPDIGGGVFDNGIEIQSNRQVPPSPTGNKDPVALGTIDSNDPDWNTTSDNPAIDLSVYNASDSGDDTVNWVVVLFDNSDGSFGFGSWDSSETYIGGIDGLPGTPLALDVDTVNSVVHVWTAEDYDDGNTDDDYEYHWWTFDYL
ncbi:MAG TPA: hypothetical protein VGB30_11220 [bacterium]